MKVRKTLDTVLVYSQKNQKDRETDRSMNQLTYRPMVQLMDRPTGQRTDRPMPMDQQIDRLTDPRSDRSMVRQINGSTDKPMDLMDRPID